MSRGPVLQTSTERTYSDKTVWVLFLFSHVERFLFEEIISSLSSLL